MTKSFLVSLMAWGALGAWAQGQQAPPVEPSPPPAVEVGPPVLVEPPDGLNVEPGPYAEQWGPGGPGCPCALGYQFWMRNEALLWWLHGQGVPPLATASPAGTAREEVGVIGNPGTKILYGGTRIDEDLREGWKISMGIWFDQCCPLGIEGNFLILGEHSTNFQAGGTGTQLIARPIVNVTSGDFINDAELIEFPEIVTGVVRVTTRSRLLGGEVRVRGTIACQEVGFGRRGGTRFRLDGFCGYRHLQLSEVININENLLNMDPQGTVPAGTRIDLLDRFDTLNQFDGGVFGLVAGLQGKRWNLEVLASVAVGPNHRTVDNLGMLVQRVPDQIPSIQGAGLLVLPSNAGRVTDTDVVLIPELGANLSLAVTEHVVLTAGYTFIFWDGVVRPGEQIDLEVNESQIPPGTLAGEERPARFRREEDLWIQGIRLGLEFRY
jgi:hypothetical protein